MCSFPAGGKYGGEPQQTWHNPRLLEVSWPPENMGERLGQRPTLQY
jgi:hypothetical protein